MSAEPRPCTFAHRATVWPFDPDLLACLVRADVTIPEDVKNSIYNAHWGLGCDEITGKYRTQNNFKEVGGENNKYAAVLCIARAHSEEKEE